MKRERSGATSEIVNMFQRVHPTSNCENITISRRNYLIPGPFNIFVVPRNANEQVFVAFKHVADQLLRMLSTLPCAG